MSGKPNIDLSLSADERAVRDLVAGFAKDHHPVAATFEAIASPQGYDPRVWERLVHEIGVPGLAVPVDQGGQGFGYVELGLAAEALGYHLAPGPFLASVCLATAFLQEGGDEARGSGERTPSEHVRRLVAGSSQGALAIQDDGRWRGLAALRTTATRDAHGWRLNGLKTLVVDGATADLLLVVARTDEGPALFWVDGQGEAPKIEPLVSLDVTRRMARITLDGTPAVRLSPEGAPLERALDVATVLLAAESLGGAQACLDAAVEYGRNRFQFGRAIGSFQAVKHMCANMALGVETLRSAVHHALRIAADGNAAPRELALAASLAKRYAGRVFFDVAKANLQVHGGMGFTWENPAHLYLRRARATEELLGNSSYHGHRLAELLGVS